MSSQRFLIYNPPFEAGFHSIFLSLSPCSKLLHPIGRGGWQTNGWFTGGGAYHLSFLPDIFYSWFFEGRVA